jgi:hypothetical protein
MTSEQWPQHEHKFEESTFDLGPDVPDVANATLLPVKNSPPEPETPELEDDHSHLHTYATEVHLRSRDDSIRQKIESQDWNDSSWSRSSEYRQPYGDYIQHETDAATPQGAPDSESIEVIPSDTDTPISADPYIEPAPESSIGEVEPGVPAAAAPSAPARAATPGSSHPAFAESDDMAWFALAMDKQQPKPDGQDIASRQRANESQPARAAAAAATSASIESAEQTDEAEDIDAVVNRVLSSYLSPNLAEQASGEIKRRLRKS